MLLRHGLLTVALRRGVGAPVFIAVGIGTVAYQKAEIDIGGLRVAVCSNSVLWEAGLSRTSVRVGSAFFGARGLF